MTYDEILAAMRSRYRELAGFDADQASDIGIRLKVLAAETAEIYEQIDALRAQVFPQTSSGEYLDLHAATRGITRKPAIPARGVLRFSRETPAYSDIPISQGIICATRPDPQVLFETVGSAVIAAGEFYADVPAVAVDAGEAGNVASGAVCSMISPASGVTGVTNSEPFTGGVDSESDEALRKRLLSAYQNISNGTNCAFYYDLAMSHEGVASAGILPRKRGRGTVDVVVSCRDSQTQGETVAAIQQDLDYRKEINVDVTVSAAARDYPSVSAEIAVRDGYSFPLVAEKVQSGLAALLDKLGVGEPLLLAEAGRSILSVDGVYNYRILLPSADILTQSDHVLRAGSITVNRMAVG